MTYPRINLKTISVNLGPGLGRIYKKRADRTSVLGRNVKLVVSAGEALVFPVRVMITLHHLISPCFSFSNCSLH